MSLNKKEFSKIETGMNSKPDYGLIERIEIIRNQKLFVYPKLYLDTLIKYKGNGTWILELK